MFANCIKYNDSSTNFYRVEAIRQRKLFLKLYGKAASQFEMGMERSEQSNSSVKSVKKTTKSSKIKTGLTSAASKKKTSRSISRKSSTKKRKQSSNKHTGESVKKCKIGPCCEEVDIPQCGFIPSSPANEVDGQLISTFEHVNDEEKKCQVRWYVNYSAIVSMLLLTTLFVGIFVSQAFSRSNSKR
jgi:cobalamin biosynthesis Mg chelatase CobN